MRQLSFHSPHICQTSHQLTYLFSKLKSMLKSCHSESVEAIKASLLVELHSIPKEVFQECFRTLKKCWQQCIRSSGEYFEGDKAE
jgi:hypothetical protein